MTTNALREIEKISGQKLTLGNLIWSIRTGDELSQSAFAKKLKISRQYLCDLERGRKFISAKKAQEFAKKLGYSSEQFIALALQDSLNQGGIHFEVILKKVA